MSVFPDTSLTLLAKLVVKATGERESSWARFFGLYAPAIRRFAQSKSEVCDPDDILQEVLLKLIAAIERGGYDPKKSSFRSYLAAMIRNEVISHFRKESVRGLGVNCSIDELEEDDGRACRSPALTVPPVQLEKMDEDWAKAIHDEAVDHVLNKTALLPRNREIYIEHVLNGRSATDVARQFNVKKNLVGQLKFRISKAIEQLEIELGVNKR